MECCTGTSDKFYRYFADEQQQRLYSSYGARGKRGQGRGTYSQLPLEALRDGQRTRHARGYGTVASLSIQVDVPSPTSQELDKAFDAAWAASFGDALAELDWLASAPAAGKSVLRLPGWRGPRGDGGHRAGRPWGWALAAALGGQPSTTTGDGDDLFVATQGVGEWTARHYPGADVVPAPSVPDEPSLLALTSTLLGTNRSLSDAVQVASATLQ